MQLYALDNLGHCVSARFAKTQKKYHCLECGLEVRLRRGISRREHFFHLKFSDQCRSSGKGIIHLQIQEALLRLFPENEAQLEVPFKSVGRIADVVWENKKVVFEVQCAPIAAEEVLERIRDYRSCGYHVVWILHCDRYGQERLTAAEKALRSHTHYYTNIDAFGKGSFFDCCYSIRFKWKTPFTTVALADLKETGCLKPNQRLTTELKMRKQSWRLHCAGDWLDLFCRLESNSRVKEILEKWPRNEVALWTRWNRVLERYFLRPYRLIFQVLLEQSCRRQ